jgi:hypothetical protein
MVGRQLNCHSNLSSGRGRFIVSFSTVIGDMVKNRKLIAVGSYWNADVGTGSDCGFGLTVTDPKLVPVVENIIQSSLNAYQRLSTTDQSSYTSLLYDQLRWVSTKVASTKDSQGRAAPEHSVQRRSVSSTSIRFRQRCNSGVDESAYFR